MIDKNLFGKDHWSTFSYIETRIVDFKGVLDREAMRVNIKIHPQFGNRASRDFPSVHYATKLNDGSEITDHDDWSCADDLAESGLLKIHGTGLHPRYSMTEEGWRVSLELRKHKASGGNFKDFKYPSRFVLDYYENLESLNDSIKDTILNRDIDDAEYILRSLCNLLNIPAPGFLDV